MRRPWLYRSITFTQSGSCLPCDLFSVSTRLFLLLGSFPEKLHRLASLAETNNSASQQLYSSLTSLAAAQMMRSRYGEGSDTADDAEQQLPTQSRSSPHSNNRLNKNDFRLMCANERLYEAYSELHCLAQGVYRSSSSQPAASASTTAPLEPTGCCRADCSMLNDFPAALNGVVILPHHSALSS